jgi:hypothetical protein
MPPRTAARGRHPLRKRVHQALELDLHRIQFGAPDCQARRHLGLQPVPDGGELRRKDAEQGRVHQAVAHGAEAVRSRGFLSLPPGRAALSMETPCAPPWPMVRRTS